MIRGSKPGWVKELAKKRIQKLLEMAEQNAAARPDKSQRYCELAWKISSRYNTPIPPQWKRRFCKKCFCFWVSGKTLAVRANRKTKTIDYVCTQCGFKKRLGYSHRAEK